MSGPVVAVTGASGFIGAYLTEALAAAGYRPLSIGRAETGAAGLEHRQTDYSPSSLRAALAGADSLIHLAGRRMTRADAVDDLGPFIGPNVEVIGRLVPACEACGVRRILLASTIAVYSPPSGAPYREPAALHPVNAYALSKVMAEQYLALSVRNRPLEALALRLAAVFGAGEKGTPALMTFVGHALAGRDITLTGNTEHQIDQIYVRDAAAAFVAALKAGSVHGALNIGGGRAASVREIAETVLEVFGHGSRLHTAPGAVRHPVDATMDISLARRQIGWTPAYSLRAGLEDFRRIVEAKRAGPPA